MLLVVVVKFVKFCNNFDELYNKIFAFEFQQKFYNIFKIYNLQKSPTSATSNQISKCMNITSISDYSNCNNYSQLVAIVGNFNEFYLEKIFLHDNIVNLNINFIMSISNDDVGMIKLLLLLLNLNAQNNNKLFSNFLKQNNIKINSKYENTFKIQMFNIKKIILYTFYILIFLILFNGLSLSEDYLCI